MKTRFIISLICIGLIWVFDHLAKDDVTYYVLMFMPIIVFIAIIIEAGSSFLNRLLNNL